MRAFNVHTAVLVCFTSVRSHVSRARWVGRYDHVHTAGDVTIWNNFLTVHNGPPLRVLSRDEKDVRLLYRISAKGPPCYQLPRADPPEWIAANITPPYTTPIHY